MLGGNLSVGEHLVGGGSWPVHLSPEILPVMNHQLLHCQQGLVPEQFELVNKWGFKISMISSQIEHYYSILKVKLFPEKMQKPQIFHSKYLGSWHTFSPVNEGMR